MIDAVRCLLFFSKHCVPSIGVAERIGDDLDVVRVLNIDMRDLVVYYGEGPTGMKVRVGSTAYQPHPEQPSVPKYPVWMNHFGGLSDGIVADDEHLVAGASRRAMEPPQHPLHFLESAAGGTGPLTDSKYI